MNVELSFEQFYRQYYDRMVSYCFHTFQLSEQDAEDIVADAFSQLWQDWNGFDNYSVPMLIAWTRKTIRFMSYSFNRKRARAPVMVELEEWITSEEAADAYPWENDPARDGRYQSYLEAIRERLTSKQLRLFNCIIVDRCDIKTAARRLHMSENTVKVSLKRLRAKIRKDILPNILN